MKKDAQRYTVEAAGALLPFLLEHGKGSRNNIKSLLSRRQVAVDGRVETRFDLALRPGQTVEVLPPRAQRGPSLPFPILYEDGEILVVDKPAGLLTIATDREKQKTAYHLCTDYVRGRAAGGRIFVVHRLDRDTSGVVLFAKTEQAKRAYQEGWETLVHRRGYAAVVEGVPGEPEGTVRSWLRETSTHLVYSSGYSGGGKEAVTRYRLRCAQEPYALLDVELDTGRKNQIRVHMQDLGHPVAGDKKYGARTNPLKRLCLHAGVLAVADPATGEERVFTAPEPAAFARLCGAARR